MPCEVGISPEILSHSTLLHPNRARFFKYSFLMLITTILSIIKSELIVPVQGAEFHCLKTKNRKIK